MGAVHAFVAEVLGEFVDAFKSAHDQTLEIKLVGYAQIERYVERVVMGHKRTCRCSAGYRLQYGGLDLHVAGCVEVFAHGVVDLGALDEDLLDAVVDHEVDVAAAVAELGVVERVVGHTVFHFDDRKRAQRLAEHGDAAGMDCDLAHLGAEHESLHSDEVADVEKFLHYGVV